MSMIGTYDNNNDSGLMVYYKPAPESATTQAAVISTTNVSDKETILTAIKNNMPLIIIGIFLIILLS